MKRLVLIGICSSVLMFLAATAIVGEFLSRPVHRQIGAAPPDLRAQSISFQTATGSRVAGWMAPAEPGAGAILLLHGVRSDRRQMLSRARFLHELGYSVLLIDLPAHGESEGDRITFGAREAAGVEAAIAYLAKNRPSDPIGVIGVSLGAAAVVLSKPVRTPDAVVLESMYPTIEEATSNRLRHYLGAVGSVFAPALLAQLPLRAGVPVEQLRPVVAITRTISPVLIVSGSADHDTPLAETMRIFDAANSPKELWIVDGADHVDLHRYAPGPYEQRISAFMAKYLRKR